MLTTVLVLALMNSWQGTSCKPQLAALTTARLYGSSTLPTWSKEDAGSWRGDGWVGWSYEGQTLRSVHLTVKDLPKQAEDDDEEVTVESVPSVDFAVRCIPAVRPGRLEVGRRQVDNHPVGNEPLYSDSYRRLGIALGNRNYELRLESAKESLADAKVVLSFGRQTQVLYSTDGFADDPHFDVVWAGDLDGDGKLDLLVNFSRKYSVHPYRLLLSSKASPGQLVGEAATFLTGE